MSDIQPCSICGGSGVVVSVIRTSTNEKIFQTICNTGSCNLSASCSPTYDGAEENWDRLQSIIRIGRAVIDLKDAFSEIKE